VTRAHRPKAGFWIRLCVLVIYPLDALLFKLRWHHLDRIPARGGVLIAVNHISQADTPTMAQMIWESGRIPRFLIKSSVFGWPIMGRIMSGAGQLPVYRSSSQAASSLRAAEQALRSGECVIIYPEGTITADPDYLPMPAKTGVARLALACPEVPVMPIGQWGAHRTLGRRGRFRPVDLSRYRDLDASADVLRAVTDEIMAAVGAQVERLRAAETRN
jgi:1-acyl-sn-glycerol-3-phosphate acyltransferase